MATLPGCSFVPVTVLLEFGWVLRGFYGLPRRTIGAVMQALAGLENVTIEDRDAVLVALDALDAGVDFADVLHVTRSARASAGREQVQLFPESLRRLQATGVRKFDTGACQAACRLGHALLMSRVARALGSRPSSVRFSSCGRQRPPRG